MVYRTLQCNRLGVGRIIQILNSICVGWSKRCDCVRDAWLLKVVLNFFSFLVVARPGLDIRKQPYLYNR